MGRVSEGQPRTYWEIETANALKLVSEPIKPNQVKIVGVSDGVAWEVVRDFYGIDTSGSPVLVSHLSNYKGMIWHKTGCPDIYCVVIEKENSGERNERTTERHLVKYGLNYNVMFICSVLEHLTEDSKHSG